jgi:hypothetical protein
MKTLTIPQVREVFQYDIAGYAEEPPDPVGGVK